ncbi:3-hydroxyacyl-CoA dehydrogenase family protein [Bacteriovorax sp. PP10]|uniref:3-hydroxyacyl-CoA dehydrogenase family protein n=1 Tax=Bacteriovorax antarcticus TaxID=3088717 RepID=A0ABU5VYB1_9BACT|nr:3-hydroxyacyl-CoA dehydrogenase family protein [Bacteriovorax sp. PP10]MEA9358026.1 3-hydroxyacyl-CoA dehydrogenase family protein [Bacteriovorax sp. PP10]
MNNEPNILVIIDDVHPMFELIKTQYETRNAKDALASFETYDLVVDLTLLKTKAKIVFLKELARTTKAEIISDLTHCWGEMVLKHTPKVTGAISLLFFSPTNSVEYFAPAEKAQKQIEDFLKKLGKTGVKHQDLKLGFHYPRVISMIVNEAYFALGENLATPESIDLAMKNGVNYPMGPIEWGQKIGLKHIIDLLSEYSEITEDPRYRISTALKLTGKYI